MQTQLRDPRKYRYGNAEIELNLNHIRVTVTKGDMVIIDIFQNIQCFLPLDQHPDVIEVQIFLRADQTMVFTHFGPNIPYSFFENIIFCLGRSAQLKAMGIDPGPKSSSQLVTPFRIPALHTELINGEPSLEALPMRRAMR